MLTDKGEGSDDGSEAGEAKSYYNKRNSFGGGSDAGSSDADGRSSLGDQRRSNRDTMASDGPSFNDRTSIGGSSRGGDDDDDDGRSMSGGIRGRGSFESDGGRSDVGSDAGSDVGSSNARPLLLSSLTWRRCLRVGERGFGDATT